MGIHAVQLLRTADELPQMRDCYIYKVKQIGVSLVFLLTNVKAIASDCVPGASRLAGDA